VEVRGLNNDCYAGSIEQSKSLLVLFNTNNPCSGKGISWWIILIVVVAALLIVATIILLVVRNPSLRTVVLPFLYVEPEKT